MELRKCECEEQCDSCNGFQPEESNLDLKIQDSIFEEGFGYPKPKLEQYTHP